jgi:pimeloyl-ACP methyl ester carboxylesterase
MSDSAEAANSAPAQRAEKFLTALRANRATLAGICITREQMADSLPPEPDPDVTDLVFVMHGIRDKGFWTQKIARTIKRLAPSGRKFESWTESYGYFAMLPFLFRYARQRKVEWLMDRYAEARARFPKAAFHYVGHSNGTYLAAKALDDYPAARFQRIVFAGSVVRSDYDWNALTARPADMPKPRVEKVLNYVATTDWVVALFPKALQRWRWFNLGSAGHDGFSQASRSGPVHQIEYIQGRHGAGHDEAHWADIARFIVSGAPPELNSPLRKRSQSRSVRVLSKVSLVLFPGIVTLVLGLGLTFLIFLFRADGAPEAAALTLGFVLYLWFVYVVVTRV